MSTLASPAALTISDNTPDGPAAFSLFGLLTDSLTMSLSIKLGMLLTVSA